MENKNINFTPTRHQLDAMDYFLRSKYKGLLLYHRLGSGKTCTAIIIADLMLKKNMINRVYILSQGSLRKTWIDQYCKRCGADKKILFEKYTFITYNYNVSEVLPDSFDNALVIIDEIHMLINSVKNGTKTGVTIYEKISSSNCRILALSGTPVFHYIYEFPLIGSLLKPEEFMDIRTENSIDQDKFMNLFDVDKDGNVTPENPAKIKYLLKGIISYFPGKEEKYYPTVIYEKPIRVKMSQGQEKVYWHNYFSECELMYIKPNEGLKLQYIDDYNLIKELTIMAKKRIMSRLASNIVYFESFKTKKDLIETKKDLIETKEQSCWITKENLKDQALLKMSPKTVALILNIIKHPSQKHVIFTFFKTKGGAYLIHSLLKLAGIKAAIFSGDLNDGKRSMLLKQYNSPENRYGKYIQVLIFTDAGAQGISLLEARHCHIFESSTRETIIQQAIGRVVRYKSHYKMPKNEQNVKIWRYWSVSNQDAPFDIKLVSTNRKGVTKERIKTVKNNTAIDELLYNEGIISVNKIRTFSLLLEEASVTPY